MYSSLVLIYNYIRVLLIVCCSAGVVLLFCYSAIDILLFSCSSSPLRELFCYSAFLLFCNDAWNVFLFVLLLHRNDFIGSSEKYLFKTFCCFSKRRNTRVETADCHQEGAEDHKMRSITNVSPFFNFAIEKQEFHSEQLYTFAIQWL